MKPPARCWPSCKRCSGSGVAYDGKRCAPDWCDGCPDMKKPALVLLRCRKRGCPRRRRIERDETMPRGTVEIVDFCPWHEQSGTKGDAATYFNANGVEVVWEP